MARKCFYSFHYKPDNWRASQVRNIGVVEGNQPVSDNDWEEVTKSGDAAIKKWIADQLSGRLCTVVLVGKNTANRKWINHEIIESWNASKGIVGIYIHGLKNTAGETSTKGNNPFDYITYKDGENKVKKLSSVIKCHNPTGSSSKARYDWIQDNLETIVENAIENKN